MTTSRRRLSLRTRLLAAMLATVLVVLALFDLAAIRLMRGYLEGRVDNNLSLVELAIARRAEPGLLGAGAGVTLGRVGYGIALVNAQGDRVGGVAVPSGGSFEIPTEPAALAASGRIVTVGSTDSGSTYRLGVVSSPSRQGVYLVVVASLDEMNRTVTRMQRVLWLGTLVGFAVVASAGWVITRRGLRPLERVSQVADSTSGGDLSARVQVSDETTEVGRLGTAFNAMLGRIESSVQERERDHARMRAFMSDASHELRTPLTAVRAYAELYEQGALRDPTAVDEALARIGSESRRMSELVDQLLTLARIEEYPAGGAELVDLAALVRDAVADVRTVDVGRVWSCEVGSESVVVSGSRDELRRLVDNLVVNVRRHTPPGTPAAVSVSVDAGRALIRVADSGPGAPPETLGRLFDRFYRAPQAGGPGSGLGLSIVAAIAARHGGEATAAAAHPGADPPGLLVTVSIPVSRPA